MLHTNNLIIIVFNFQNICNAWIIQQAKLANRYIDNDKEED